MERSRALALLARAPVVHLAATTPEGAPVLRALDAAVLDDAVAFHGAAVGEKARCAGRPAVVSAEEVVARIPSWAVDPEQACRATTFYRSVQIHGTLRSVEDPARKARVLEALMRRWQPEGRHLPIDPGAPRYAARVREVLVLEVPLDAVDGKEALGQGRPAADLQGILAALWTRGAPGDDRAIEAIRRANPALPAPELLAGPEGFRLSAALDPVDLPAAVELLAGEYWWEDLPRDGIAPAQLASTAWVGAHDAEGRLAATARAVSDGKCAWIYDVAVRADVRGRGLGKRVVALVLDHPAVRGARCVRLATRDAQGLYERFGFRNGAPPMRRPSSTEMVLLRTR